MKLLVCLAVIAIGCHKEPRTAAANADPVSGNAGSAASGLTGSQMAASASGAGGGSAAAPAAAPVAGSSEARKAIDDFDRLLAPIWKLPQKDRLDPLCKTNKALLDKANEIQKLAPPAGAVADRWKDEATRLATTVNTLDLCCKGGDETCINEVHDVFAGLVALVPGATPADSHAGDAVTSDAPSPPIDASKIRAAAHAAEVVLAGAAASKAKTPAELCVAGHRAVQTVEAVLNAPGLDPPPGVAAQWRDQLAALLMNAGAFDGQHCQKAKMSDLETIKDALSDLHDRAKELEALLAKK
jgi:hypothetical protein